jgi:hypothetical protein
MSGTVCPLQGPKSNWELYPGFRSRCSLHPGLHRAVAFSDIWVPERLTSLHTRTTPPAPPAPLLGKEGSFLCPSCPRHSHHSAQEPPHRLRRHPSLVRRGVSERANRWAQPEVIPLSDLGFPVRDSPTSTRRSQEPVFATHFFTPDVCPITNRVAAKRVPSFLQSFTKQEKMYECDRFAQRRSPNSRRSL